MRKPAETRARSESLINPETPERLSVSPAGAGPTVSARSRRALTVFTRLAAPVPANRTMIDALAPALEGLGVGLDTAARAAREGADLTAGILKAGAGRASYVSEGDLAGHNDPGAEAVTRLFEGLAAG